MTNGDERQEERLNALEELTRITTAWAGLMQEAHEEHEEWIHILEQRQQASEERQQRIEGRQEESRQLVQGMLAIVSAMQADIARIDAAG